MENKFKINSSQEEDLGAINYILENPTDPDNTKLKGILGLSDEDISAYKYTLDNPNDPDNEKLKDIVYKKVANTMPISNEQGVSMPERAIIKNLLYREPADQMRYLEKKGYDVKRNEGGELLVRSPGSTRYTIIDPKGFDWQDITDIGSDVLSGVATGVGSGAKALGLIGAPITGGMSALAGAGLGGALTAGVEGLRQVGGKLVGGREKFEPKKIATEGAIGAAIPLGFSAIKGAYGLGKGLISKAAEPFIGGTKAEAPSIIKAAENLGLPTTPAQLSTSAPLTGFESYLKKTPLMGGGTVKDMYRTIKNKLGELGENISKESTIETGYQIGGKIKNLVLEGIDEKLLPAEKIYKTIETTLKDTKVVKDSLYKTISDLADEARFDATGASGNLLKKMKGIVDEISSVNDLKKFRTSIGKILDKNASEAQINIVKKLYPAITDARNDSLIRGASTLDPQSRYLAVKQIKEADQIYRNVMNSTNELKDIVESTVDDKIMDSVFNVKNIKQLNLLKTEFPKAFEQARSRKIADILTKSEINGKLSTSRLITNFNKLPQEAKTFIFGEDMANKLADLKTYLSAFPKDLNPSGTGTYKEFSESIVNPIAQIKSKIGGTIYNIITGKGMPGAISNINKKISPSAVKGSAYLLQNQMKGE